MIRRRWAESVPHATGIAPRVRVRCSRWFNLLWVLLDRVCVVDRCGGGCPHEFGEPAQSGNSRASDQRGILISWQPTSRRVVKSSPTTWSASALHTLIRGPARIASSTRPRTARSALWFETSLERRTTRGPRPSRRCASVRTAQARCRSARYRTRVARVVPTRFVGSISGRVTTKVDPRRVQPSAVIPKSQAPARPLPATRSPRISTPATPTQSSTGSSRSPSWSSPSNARDRSATTATPRRSGLATGLGSCFHRVSWARRRRRSVGVVRRRGFGARFVRGV